MCESYEEQLKELEVFSLEKALETLLYFTVTLKEVVERWGLGSSPTQHVIS